MAGFYVAGAHPWAASALFSAAPPGPPPLSHAFSPEEVTQMLLDHGAAIRGIREELALLRELLTGRPPPPRASLLASSATTLPTPSTGPFALETAEKMLTRQVSAAVRLQAAARGLLARRWVGRQSATRFAADSAPHPVTVPSGCSSSHKGDDHSSATSGGVAAAGGGTAS
jgi:hypothetical protein